MHQPEERICKTCCFWAFMYGEWDKSPSGSCTMMDMPETRISIELYGRRKDMRAMFEPLASNPHFSNEDWEFVAGIITPFDFGCTEWQAR